MKMFMAEQHSWFLPWPLPSPNNHYKPSNFCTLRPVSEWLSVYGRWKPREILTPETEIVFSSIDSRHLLRPFNTLHFNWENRLQKFHLPYISIHTLFELLAPHSISIVKVSSATLPQGVVGWRQVTTTRRSQVSRLVAIQGVPSQSYVQRCFWPAPVQHHHGYERPFSRMGTSCPMVGVYVRWNCPSLIKSGCGAWWWNWCGG